MYIRRHIESTIKKMLGIFPAILVTGPRQVGKITMLRETIGDKVSFVTLDDPILLNSAINAGHSFFRDNPPPLFIDEIQRAPNLFLEIKYMIDKNKKNGSFYLSGSQQFQMMKGVSESLSGRIGIVELLGLSNREIDGIPYEKPFVPDETYISDRRKYLNNLDIKQIWQRIQRGSLPEIYAESDIDHLLYYGSYLRTYLERDVRELTQVGDLMKFQSFLIAVAGRTGQILNVSSLANDVGISMVTANKWLSILECSRIIYLLKPYHSNILKRAMKTPKLYFLDTGLAAYLLGWNTPDTLSKGAMSGAFFETYVIGEILKSYFNQGVLDPHLYFYRDKDKKEIDLIIEREGVLYPIEIKKHADPSVKDLKNFSVIDNLPDVKRGEGCIICTYENVVTIKDSDKTVPVSYI